MKQLKIIWLYAQNSFQMVLQNRLILLLFLLAKFIRISLFVVFLHFIFRDTSALAGYSREQIIFFYLAFNLVDTAAQLLFREVYRFRPLVISGSLDYILVKPVNPLIRVLVGGPDLIDVFMLFLLIIAVSWYAAVYIHPGLSELFIFLILFINGLFIAAAFHILVLGLFIITVSVDHLVMIYRDLTSLLWIPVDLYIEPIRSLLTFIIPLGIMLTFPAKAIFGLLSPALILISLILGVVSFFASVRFWHWSLHHYQSASS